MLIARRIALASARNISIRCLSTTCTRWARPSAELAKLDKLSTEEDHALARDWIAGFEPDDIPKGAWDISYSRSSGPGGQHVNTTSSKATLRLDLSSAAGNWLPRFIMSHLKANTQPHYSHSPASLLISASSSRSAPQNAQVAVDRMFQLIHGIARPLIRGETSQETKDRVERHKEKATKTRLKGKTFRSMTKASRRGDL